MPKRIIRVNASLLKQSTCFLRVYRLGIEGYKSPCQTNDIEFGSAGHLFLSEMAKSKGDLPASLCKARDYFKDTPMLINPQKKYLDDLALSSACVQYWSHLQREDTFKILVDDKGEPAVEVTFDNKYYEDEQFEVRLQGTIDKIGKFDNGCFALGDYKFTSRPWGSDVKRKMEDYFKQHEMGCQLRFYLYNILLKAKNEPSELLSEITKRQVGCFIDAIFTSPSEAAEFKRSRIFFFSLEDMQEFENMLKGFVMTLLTILKQDTIPPRHGVLNGACAGGYKPCQFIDVCNAPSEVAKQHVLKNNFKQEPYMPIGEKD